MNQANLWRRQWSAVVEYHVAGVAPVHEPAREVPRLHQLHERLEHGPHRLSSGQQRREEERARRQRVDPRRHGGRLLPPLLLAHCRSNPPRGGQCHCPARSRFARTRRGRMKPVRRRARPENNGARHCQGPHPSHWIFDFSVGGGGLCDWSTGGRNRIELETSRKGEETGERGESRAKWGDERDHTRTHS